MAADDPGAPGDLLARPLWQIEFGAGNPCIAKSGERPYLLLFSSRAAAEQFAAAHPVPALPPARVFLFSESRESFVQAAREARERGVQGALIDPDARGRVGARVDFDESAPE